MKTVLQEKLLAYIANNNPDLLTKLQQSQSVSAYLQERVDGIESLLDELISQSRPNYAIEEECLNALTASLRPSRYNYIRLVFEEEFPSDYERLDQAGVLAYELLNMLEVCQGIFDELEFNEENEDDRGIRYAVIGQIHDYLIDRT